MTIPTTPAECRAEQERVLKLVSAYEEANAEFEAAATEYWRNNRHLPRPMALTTLRGKVNQARKRLELDAPTLARQNAALLAAHAKALAEITEQQDILDKIAEIADAECEFEDARLTAEENRIEAAERKLAEREAELEHLRKLARRVEATMGVHEHLAATKELTQAILAPAKEVQP